MKKMILGVLLATICLQPVLAQKQRPQKYQKPTPEMMVKRMDKALLLTDVQEKQMLEIYTEMFKEWKETRSASREDRMEKKKELDKKFNEVLTEEQMEKWQKIQKKQLEKRRNHKR